MNHIQEKILPTYYNVLKNIPPLEQLQRTNGLYPFSKEDYELGISDVYNKAYYHTAEIDKEKNKNNKKRKEKKIENRKDAEDENMQPLHNKEDDDQGEVEEKLESVNEGEEEPKTRTPTSADFAEMLAFAQAFFTRQ